VGIEFLGPLTVDGQASLSPRDRVVLAALGVRHGEVVAPDQLADALWGDEPPPSWAKQVQILVMRLRKQLGPATIETSPGGYRLALSPDDLDTCRFEAFLDRGRSLASVGDPDRAASTFARGLGLWRGLPFDDLSDWPPGRSEAARLDELRRTAEEDLLDARLAAGEHHLVAAEAEARVAEEPLRERRWAILALSQYRCGRQGDALRSLHQARRTLAEQLGIEPGAELVALEAAILRQDPALAATAAPPTEVGTCPYKGLAFYDVTDRESFFGRDDEIAACLARLDSSRFLVVSGPSGCGKSSLVRAGLVPALQRRGHSVTVFVPGRDPDTALAEARVTGGRTTLLVVDQLEELLALDGAPEAAESFCTALATHASEVAPVVVAIRADRLAALAANPTLARLTEQGLHLVSPMRDESLRAAIEGPAEQAGLRLEHGLVDLLVRDTEGEPGALPLLSHALVETWRRRDGRVLTVEGYRATGGIRGAVARSADRLYESLTAEERTTLRSLLLRLVATSPDGEPIRSRVSSRVLGGDPARERLIGLLVRTRLVTAEADTVEVAHEALVRAWPRLRSWLDEDAAGQRILRHLAAAADGWESLGRPDSELYRGARLDAALEWRAGADPDLTITEAAFLDAAVGRRDHEREAEEDRRQQEERLRRKNRQRTRQLIGGGVVLALVATSAVFGFVQRGEAQRLAGVIAASAEPRRLTAASTTVVETDPDLAMLLAMEALDRSAEADIPALLETEEGLHWALQAGGVPYPAGDAPVEVRTGPRGPTGIYRLPIDELVGMARQHLGDRALTTSECERFSIEPCPSGRAQGSWPRLPAEPARPPLPQQDDRPLAGTTIRLLTNGDAGLQAALDRFEEQTGISVELVPFGEFDGRTEAADVAVWPQPAFDVVADEGQLVDLSRYIDTDQARAASGDYLVDLGSRGSAYYGIPATVETKGLVWYAAPEFAAAGYAVPQTWDELVALSRQMVADGRTPWCIGLESDGNFDGWPATDWIEALVLRLGGVDLYDRWMTHEVGFEDPTVRQAFELFGQIAFGNGFVLGGVESINRVNWIDAIDPLATDPPGCMMTVGASYMDNVLPDGAEIGTDVASFVLPPIEQGGPAPLFGADFMVGANSDRPEVRALMRGVATTDWGEQLVADPSNATLVGNVAFDATRCAIDSASPAANAVRVQLCEQATEAVAAGQWRVDASDLMPEEIGSGSDNRGRGAFLQGLLDYVEQGPASLDRVLASIDAAWP
jgi:DNA-binding SARP family transcriptional activator/ABC-type glycerol-3-phosphate transport system substrate-binding protein